MNSFICEFRRVLPLGIILGCAEHFLISLIEMAYTHDALIEGAYLTLLHKFQLLGLPGKYLPQIFGITPYYWVAHSEGTWFWLHMVFYFSANIVGWAVIVALVRLAWKATVLPHQRKA